MCLASSSTGCQERTRTYQILGIERDLVPPRRHKLIVAVEDSAVHVLIPPRVEEGLEPTESGDRTQVSSVLVPQINNMAANQKPEIILDQKLKKTKINITRFVLLFLFSNQQQRKKYSDLLLK